MLQPSLRLPLRQLTCCRFPTTQLHISPRLPLPAVTITHTSIRHATHKSEGRANGAKNGPGKRLGAKKTGGQYVIPGNILYRQRGTLWFPGDNVGLGKDHTLYATAPGYVTYYRDPQRHKTRQYIGVVLKKEHTLPVQQGVARRRMLGMYAQRIGGEDAETFMPRSGGEEGADGAASVVKNVRSLPPPTSARLGPPDRKQNWRLGQTLDAAQSKVRPYKSGERFLAWRKRKVGAARAAEKRGLKGSRKGKKT